MCGIFGLTIRDASGWKISSIKDISRKLFLLSESRGKEASGVSVSNHESLVTYKDAVPASRFIHDKTYHQIIGKAFMRAVELNSSGLSSFSLMGHSRLVTNGSEESYDNNQPVIVDKLVGMHNGIIVNCDLICNHIENIERKYDVDSEIIFRLIEYNLLENNLINAIVKTYDMIEGVATISIMFSEYNCMLLATNNGSLYQVCSDDKSCHVFSSERYILETAIRKTALQKLLASENIEQVKAGSICLIRFDGVTARGESMNQSKGEAWKIEKRDQKRQCTHWRPKTGSRGGGQPAWRPRHRASPLRLPPVSSQEQERRDRIKRCNRCILPGTMPFVAFDENGVCNFCRASSRLTFYGRDALEKRIAPHRRGKGRVDCLVGVSGGRDSVYTLYYVKEVLGMHPIAFTYDWGMVTDLARRNISRVCAKLGVEHILISADIRKKRENIRKNVSAWLKKPHLGMVPLFMAGDKQYFYHAQQLRRKTKVDLIILGENMLERTDFKTGFAGIKPDNSDKNHVYTLSYLKNMKLLMFYLDQIFHNAKYINSSMLDTIYAYICYYLLDKSYVNLYKYIEWNEDIVVSTIIDQFGWECAEDTNSTWRIGDGTAPFYNYIYYTVAGFTENDTFRSNQIREGLISRARALDCVKEENRPRIDSILWYLNTIHMNDDPYDILKRINEISKSY